MTTMNAPKLCLFVLGVATFAMPASPKQKQPPISAADGEILLRLTEDAHGLRRERVRLFVDHWAKDLYDDPNFFYYSLYSGRQGVASRTVGHFAVNKYTGAVWDLSAVERVKDEELEEITGLLLQKHGISAAELKAHHNDVPSSISKKRGGNN